MKKSSYFVFLLASLSLCLLSCGGGNGTTATGGTGGGTGGIGSGTACGAQSGTLCYTLTINGVARNYMLHVPTNFQANTSALVIVLPGSGSTALGMEPRTGFSTLADQVGFAVVYPDGLIHAGETDWAYYFNDFNDDVSFFRQLITQLQTSVKPDPKKIFVAGHSAGGFMAHRIGVELSDLVAAIGSVEGAISSGGTVTSVPAAAGPVSVLILHGDQDNTVQYCGSQFDASQEDTFNYWSGSQGNSCSTLDTATPLCDSQGNISPVVEKTATNCSANTEVKIYKLIGGAHAYTTTPMNDPNGVPYNPDFDSSTGTVTTNILWNFFATHPKP